MLRRRIRLLTRASSARGGVELLAAAAGSTRVREAMLDAVEQRRAETREVLQRGLDRGAMTRELRTARGQQGRTETS